MSADSSRADRTAELVREILRRNREEKARGFASPNAAFPPEDAPVPQGDAVVSDAVARVLAQMRGGCAVPPAPPAPPLPSASSPSLPSPAAPPVMAGAPPLPPPLAEDSLTNLIPSGLAAAPPPLADDAALLPPPPAAERGAFKKRKRRSESRAERRAKDEEKKEKEALDARAASFALGALAGTVAPTAVAAVPDEFLASITLAPAAPEANLGSLALAGAAGSPDVFLQELSQTNVSDENAADTRELLGEQSTLKKAADDAPSWLTSLIIHLIVLLFLAFLFIKTDLHKTNEIVSEPGFSDEVVIDEVFDPDAAVVDAEKVEVDAESLEVDSEIAKDVPDVSAFNEDSAEALTVTEEVAGLEASLGDVENLLGTLNGDDLAGRGEMKAALIASGGGSEGSEKSVALALAWIAEHQLPDGSWSFQIGTCPTCGGRCRNPGSKDAWIAATSIALLPFLAAGNTPTTGKYKKVVAKGINYLMLHGVSTEYGVSFREEDSPEYAALSDEEKRNAGGNMYSHGLAAITLCETYAMLSPRDKRRFQELGYLAQDAIRFIENAQLDDGGWRYTPQQKLSPKEREKGYVGDTSVAGWQLMALKSAQLAGLGVDAGTVRGARDFLRDVVSFDYESRYNYTAGVGSSNATDSIGLLCRLYLDWGIENPDLIRGVNRLSDIGPRLNDPYYTYDAAQLMYNVGGSTWNRWNGRVRDELIRTQEMEGHERGSWFPQNADGHCITGGRLYATSLNCMVLEVYYRHMPLYQKMEQSTNFPIDVPAE